MNFEYGIFVHVGSDDVTNSKLYNAGLDNADKAKHRMQSFDSRQTAMKNIASFVVWNK